MATIYVTTDADSGAGSLRAAIASAASGDVIRFAPSLNAADVSVASVLEITAGKNITIEGGLGGGDELFAQGELLKVDAGATVTIENLALIGGASGAGDFPPTNGAQGTQGTPGLTGVNGSGASGGKGTAGGDGGDGSTGSAGVNGLAAIENAGTLTLISAYVGGFATGGDGSGPAKGGAGGGGGTGGAGAAGTPMGGNGADGSNGGNGGNGANGSNGGEAVGAIVNDAGAKLTLQDTLINGSATGGNGGDGGDGGDGGAGGDGGGGGAGNGTAQHAAVYGKGGNGANGGDGGDGANGGDGGAAVGGILGSITMLAGVVFDEDSATGGSGGEAGYGGMAGQAGIPGVSNGGGPTLTGKYGVAGTAGADGSAGVDGTEIKDLLNKGTVSGSYVDGGYDEFASADQDGSSSLPLQLVTIAAGQPGYFSFDVIRDGAPTSSATVGWKVVVGANSPSIADFGGTTLPSGVLTYSTTYDVFSSITINLVADATTPRAEYFTVELYNPSAGDELGAYSSVDVEVENDASTTLATLSSLAYKTSYEAVFSPAGGTVEIVDTAAANAVVATISVPGQTLAGELITLAASASGTAVGFTAAPFIDVPDGDVLFSGLKGRAYTAYQSVYDDGAFAGIDYDFNVSASGGYEDDYTSGNDFVGSKVYSDNAASYATAETDYDGAGRATRVAYTGTNAAYSGYEYDYVGGIFAGSKFTYQSYSGTYSSYEVDYNQANAFAGDKFFFDNSYNQADYTQEEDFDANGKLTKVILGDAAPYASIEEDFSAGVYSGEKVFYDGLSGAYSGEEVDVSSTGQIQAVVYSGLSGKPYTSVEEDYSGGAVKDAIYGFTGISGQSYFAYQVEDNAAGAAQQETLDLNSGGHETYALTNNQTLVSQGDDVMVGDATAGTTTTFRFEAIYGAETIQNFNTSDKVFLPSSEFTNLSTMLNNHATQANGNVTITALDGDSLVIDGTSKTALSSMTANFTFS
jgi:hypothetical protein